MNDPRSSELAAQIATLQANVSVASQSFTELKSLAERAAVSAKDSVGNGGRTHEFDALARALAAERRLECLIRLAAGIIPAHFDSDRPSYRPPSAWRALSRELSRAKRHLARARGTVEE
jgi:hypothetical protein